MRYSVEPTLFEIHPTLTFGILIGEDVHNSTTLPEDEARLRLAERKMRERYQAEQVRELMNVALYRKVMTQVGLNPNKFPPSVEAMFKRVLKGGNLPVINGLVDLCNAVSLEQMISLGAHDLQDIQEDLQVRFSKEGDRFLPFGVEDFEPVEAGELVFASGQVVQTRKWIWRQSELGKTTVDSTRLFFQLVGFQEDSQQSLQKGMLEIEQLIVQRFQGRCKKYIVDARCTAIDF